MCLNDSMYSALHLLRSYNQYLGPMTALRQTGNSCDANRTRTNQNSPDAFVTSTLIPPSSLIIAPPAYSYASPVLTLAQSDIKNALRGTGCVRRARCEKKPIPDEQKDDKYYERRKRNNQAAKKSRDARRMREDHTALRATILEHENAVLRAQVLTLREEAQSLRQLLFHHTKNETLDICTV